MPLSPVGRGKAFGLSALAALAAAGVAAAAAVPAAGAAVRGLCRILRLGLAEMPALAFAIALFARPLGVFLGVPTTPLVLVALFVVLVRRAREA